MRPSSQTMNARLPQAWAVLEQALIQRRPVRAAYHGRQRLLSPHALGWKNGRPKVLAYQADTTASSANPHQQWRSMFVDEIENPVISDDPWETADNYSPNSNCIDKLKIAIPE